MLFYSLQSVNPNGMRHDIKEEIVFLELSIKRLSL